MIDLTTSAWTWTGLAVFITVVWTCSIVAVASFVRLATREEADVESEDASDLNDNLSDLVGWAITIISNVDAPEAAWPHQSEEWRVAARRWLDKATPWLDDYLDELAALDRINPRLADACREIAGVLWDFEWVRYPGDPNGPIGEIRLAFEEGDDVIVGAPNLKLDVWCPDSESGVDIPLAVFRRVDYRDAQSQIRQVIHDHLTHEADEQMWFGADRPFYPQHPDRETVEIPS